MLVNACALTMSISLGILDLPVLWDTNLPLSDKYSIHSVHRFFAGAKVDAQAKTSPLKVKGMSLDLWIVNSRMSINAPPYGGVTYFKFTSHLPVREVMRRTY